MEETQSLNVIAIGGGRIYADETKNIDNYVFSILPRENRSIAVLATASKDRADYIEAIKKVYEGLGVKVAVIYESDLVEGKLNEILSTSSGLYIGGGDTAYLLEVLKNTNSRETIKKYAKSGKVIVGLSAGAALLFERAIFFEDEKASSVEGLGILKGIVIPHFTQSILEKCKDLIIEFGEGKDIYGISNGSALYFTSQDGHKIIAEPYSVGVWKISVNSGNVSQEKL